MISTYLPFFLAVALSASIAVIAWGAELIGPRGIRRVRLVASLAFVISFFALCVVATWLHSAVEGALLLVAVVSSTIGYGSKTLLQQVKGEWIG